MKISGFSMVKNGIKLYYPVVEMIKSILPIVDEFVIAIGKGDDDTREKVEGINDPKIKIIDTVWDLEKYPRGMENAHPRIEWRQAAKPEADLERAVAVLRR
ncbi:MAG: hypothetical protein R6V47_03355, partial [Candidatus Delongbacteria bacterium]